MKNKDEFLEEAKKFETATIIRKKVKQSVLSYLPAVLSIFLIITLSALGSLLQFNFDINKIIWSSFFITLGLRVALTSLSRFLGSNLYYERGLISEDYLEKKRTFLAEIEKVNFFELEEWLKEKNLINKREIYIANQKEKITTYKIRINALFFRNQLKYRRRRLNLISIYEKKIEKTEKLLTEDFILANLVAMKVKHFRPLKAHYFLSPSEEVGETGEKYKINANVEMGKETIKGIPFTASCCLLGFLITFSISTGTINALSLIYDLLMVFLHFIFGWFGIGKKTLAKAINTFIYRTIVLQEYKRSKN